MMALYNDKIDWSLLELPLADHIWYLRNQYPHFIETMWMMDPLGEGDCGFIALEFFDMFLGGHVHADFEMRKFLIENMRKDLEYFKTSRILATMQRQPGVNDDDWLGGGGGLEGALGVLCFDFDEDDRESMFDIGVYGGEEKTQLDCRHLEVFAKATKTRILLLFCWVQYEQKENKTTERRIQFTCLDIDWRETEETKHEPSKPPEIKFCIGMPNFSEDFDFYRTAVIMNAPSGKSVQGDYLVYSVSLLPPLCTQPVLCLFSLVFFYSISLLSRFVARF